MAETEELPELESHNMLSGAMGCALNVWLVLFRSGTLVILCLRVSFASVRLMVW